MKRLLIAPLLFAACGGAEEGGTANEVPLGLPTETAPAPGVYPFQGVWAGEGASCEDVGLDLETGPLVITTQSVQYYDDACDIATVETLAENERYRVDMRCTGDGRSDNRSQQFSVASDTLTITDDTGTRTYQRCDPSDQNE